MKKMVFFINSLDSGGAERVMSNLLNSFINTHDCYLILIHDDIFYTLDDRVNIIYLHEKKDLSKLTKFLRLPIIAFKLAKIIKKNKFNRIVSFLTRANYINILSNIFINHKVIINERAMPSLQYNNGINGKINRFLIKILYPKSSFCLTNSYGNMIDLKDNFNIKKLSFVHNPFNIKMIEEMSKEKIKIDKKRFTFITIGRLDKGKNHMLMLEALKYINADLLIIGNGELKNELNLYIKNNNLEDKVYLLGKKENPFCFLSIADSFIFTSNHEGFPNVLVEALVCGLPIISTDCLSGPREILAPSSDPNFQLTNDIELAEYGILTPIKNTNKLVESMNLIINNKILRKEYQEKAKQRANDFRIEKIINEYKSIIND